MSQPFAVAVSKLVKQRTDQELADEAFARFNRWSMLSTDKLVSLDEATWMTALIVKAFKAAGVDIQKTETRDANGARVVGVVASDGVSMSDGAG